MPWSVEPHPARPPTGRSILMASRSIRHRSHRWRRQSSPDPCTSKATSQTAITLLLPNKRVLQTSCRPLLPTAPGPRAVCLGICFGLPSIHPREGDTQQPYRPIRVSWVWAPQRQPSISLCPCHLFARNKNEQQVIQTELRDLVSEFFALTFASKFKLYSLRSFTSRRQQRAQEVMIGGVHDAVLVRVFPPASAQIAGVTRTKLGSSIYNLLELTFERQRILYHECIVVESLAGH